MEILWHGHSFFEIETKTEKGKIKVAIDPFSPEIGLKAPKVRADLLLISHDHFDHNYKEAIEGNYFLIDKPGEYEVGGVFVTAILSFHDSVKGKSRGENLIFLLDSEEMRVCHLGDFGQKELENHQLEKIGQVDLLMIPVGGKYTISAKEAIKILEQIEPKITIPMHYFLPKLKIKLDGAEEFLKVLGIKELKPEKKLSIKKENLPEEGKIVLLEPK